MADPFLRLVRSLARGQVRFVVIGLSGANLYARAASQVFATQDRDLFLPPDPANAIAAWQACESVGLDLFCGDEPLDRPRDLFIAERVVANRALVRGTDRAGLEIDLTLVMGGFDFETVWSEKRSFRVGRVEIPVARLAHIIESKRRAARAKDQLFLATHADAIDRLVAEDDPAAPAPSNRRPQARPRS